jgi:DNA polymerase-3 subunit delta
MATRRTSKSRATDPLAELKKKGPQPVYAIDGEERGLVDEFVHALREAAVPPAARDFNYEVFSGKEVTLARVVDVALTLPAFAQRRMVLVQQADKLNVSDPEPLLRYLESPSPTTVLAFVADKFDARGKVYKAFQRAGAAVRFARPRPHQMPDLVAQRATAMGLALTPPAVRALVDAVGPDLGAAVKALELLDLYRGTNTSRALDADDVTSVVQTAREESIFDLVDAIGQRERARVLFLLQRLLVGQREPGLRVLALVARHFRHLMMARELLARGQPPSALASAVGIPPFLVDKLARQARQFSEADLVQGHAAIKHADRVLKSTRVRDVRVMERLAMELM